MQVLTEAGEEMSMSVQLPHISLFDSIHEFYSRHMAITELGQLISFLSFQ